MPQNVELSLQESEELFRSIFNLAAVGIAQIGLDGHWLRINQKLCDIVGYTEEELKNLSIRELTHPDDLGKHLTLVHRLLAGEIEYYSHEKRAFHKNGSIVWLSLTVSLVRDPAGNPKYSIAVIEDITARKAAEEALRDSEALFRIVFDQAFQMMGLLKPDGTLITINKTAAELIKQKQPGMISKTISVRMWESYFTAAKEKGAALLDKPFWEMPWWADMPQLQDCLRGAVMKAAQGEVVRCEVNFQISAGEIKWVDLLLTPMLDDDGNVVLLVPEARDITETKQAEELLRGSEQKLGLIYDKAPFAIALAKLAEGIIVDVNEAWVKTFGHTKEEAVGKNSLELGISDPEGRTRLYAELQQRGSVRDMEASVFTKSGTSRVISINVDMVVLHGQEYLLSTMQDITSRKDAEKEIEQLNRQLSARTSELENANQELEAFNSSVTHDLRKPLTIINGYSQAIMEIHGDALDPECKKYIEEIYNGTLRMNQLIDALLKFALTTHGELRRELLNLSDMAKTVAVELRLTEPERRVTLKIAEGVTIHADKNLLQVVMENLLGNAWKYTGKQEAAVIEFGAKEVEGKQVYFVRDNGVGFDMSQSEKLFIPFQRLSATNEYKGHGIGLATVERIIKRHGGRVWAESEPDKETTFYFTVQN